MKSRHIAFVLTLIAAPAMGIFVGVPTAVAATCPSSPNHDFVSESWSNGGTFANIDGVRAPIKKRTDGTVCSGGTETSFSASWIAIQTSNGTAITQIGFIHQAISGGSEFCRFWAIGSGAVHDYACGTSGNDVYEYFQIQNYVDPATHAHYYDIEDCGTSGYGSCTSEDATAPTYSNPWGVVAAENDYGKGCLTNLMGYSADPQNVGTSANPLQWQNSVGGTWATKTMSSSPAQCTDYRGSFSNTVFSSWDSRNSS